MVSSTTRSASGDVQIRLQDESPEESALSHLEHLLSASLIKAAPKQDVAPNAPPPGINKQNTFDAFTG